MKLKFDALEMRPPAFGLFAEGDPPPAGGGDPPADPPAPPAADPKPADQENISLPKSAFDARIEQAKRAGLKEAGIDPDQVKKDREELAKLKAEAEERKKAEMTDRERLEAEKAEAEAKAKEAMERAERSDHRAHVVEVCAKHGIRDIDYAMFRIGKREEGQSIDDFLSETLKDETEKTRFGVAPAGAPAPAKTTTTGTPENAPPKPSDGGAPVKPVSQMTKQEFAEHKRKKHGAH